MQKIRAEIHLGNIRRNAEAFKALTGKRLCAVVKANAYGHGAEEVVAALSGVADCFAVALLDEGLAIRTAACGKEVLVFTPPLNEEEAYAFAVNGFAASISDLWTARLLVNTCERCRLPIKAHLKVNTGMNRYGMNGSMLGKVCRYLQGNPWVRVEGIYSHLYDSEEKNCYEQRDLFLRAVGICRRYFPEAIAHLSATQGSLLGEKFAFDMTRVGIGLYGYLPQGIESGAKKCGEALRLQKGMTVYAVTTASRKYAFGGAGYGKPLEVFPKRLSVLRIGYADGFLRQRENGLCGEAENANTLCMDVCIRKNNARRGQWIPVMTNADAVARATGTISYEVLCAATRRAEFIYDDN